MGDFLRFCGLAVLGLDHLPVQVEALSARLRLVEAELRELRVELVRDAVDKARPVRAVPAPVARIGDRTRLGPPGRKTPRGGK